MRRPTSSRPPAAAARRAARARFPLVIGAALQPSGCAVRVDDADGAGGALGGRLLDLLARPAGRVEEGDHQLVVEAEHAWRGMGAALRPDATVPLEADLERHPGPARAAVS